MLTIRQPEAALMAVGKAIELEPNTPSGHYIQAYAPSHAPPPFRPSQWRVL